MCIRDRLEMEREITKKSILDFKFKGFDSYEKDLVVGCVDINEIKLVHMVDKRIPIICSLPGLPATLIDGIEGCIPITCNDYV